MKHHLCWTCERRLDVHHQHFMTQPNVTPVAMFQPTPSPEGIVQFRYLAPVVAMRLLGAISPPRD